MIKNSKHLLTISYVKKSTGHILRRKCIFLFCNLRTGVKGVGRRRAQFLGRLRNRRRAKGES